MSKNNSIIITTSANCNSVNSFVLAQASYFYNPYSVVIKTKAYEICTILFYDETGVKARTQSGWFGSNNDIDRITFFTKNPISHKTKLVFNTASPFVIKTSCDYKNNYDLYIPVSDLPKFEISYKKSNIGIEKYTDIGLPDPTHNYIKEIVKYFMSGYDAKDELVKAIKALDDYDIARKTDEEFNSAISNIQSLRQKMLDAYEKEKNYSVEDYLKNHKE